MNNIRQVLHITITTALQQDIKICQVTDTIDPCVYTAQKACAPHTKVVIKIDIQVYTFSGVLLTLGEWHIKSQS